MITPIEMQSIYRDYIRVTLGKNQIKILSYDVPCFQSWLDKAKLAATESEKKRKRSDNDTIDKLTKENAAKKKKPLSQSTNAKLSAFAFNKS